MPRVEQFPEPHMYSAYGLYLLTSQHRLMRSLKRVYAPSVHGHKTWRSSFVLMDYLIHAPVRRGTRVMEIGCGWAPASVFCAKRFGARVTGVDMDEDVFPFMEVIAALNDVEVAPLHSRFEGLAGRRLGEHRLIIGSDICFWDRLIEPLFRLIGRALKSGTRRVVITDPGRPTFYELADLCAKRFDARLEEWYALEPNRVTGEVLEVRAK